MRRKPKPKHGMEGPQEVVRAEAGLCCGVQQVNIAACVGFDPFLGAADNPTHARIHGRRCFGIRGEGDEAQDER